MSERDRVEVPTPDELRGLYHLAPGDFVGARNRLAAQLAAGGRKGAAAAVRRLSRPTPALWAVNRLARDAEEEVATLLDVGDRLRRAQARVLAGSREAAGDLRDLGAEEARIIDRLRAAAAGLLVAGGHAATEDTLRRVESSLRSAAVADRDVKDAVREGRLGAELEPSGFGDLPVLTVVPGTGGGASGEETSEPGTGLEDAVDRAMPQGQRAGMARREELARREAEARFAAARARLRVAELDLARMEAAAERADLAAANAAERLERLSAELSAAQEQAARADQEKRRAAAALAVARQELEKARALVSPRSPDGS